MDDRLTLLQRWEAYRPAKALWFWSCVACVAMTILLGFGEAGWQTRGSTAKMVSDAASNAKTQLAASICVNRFNQATDAVTQLVALRKTAFWQRSEFIEKRGWATPPGTSAPVSGAADLCAQRLAAESAPTTTASPTTTVVATPRS